METRQYGKGMHEKLFFLSNQISFKMLQAILLLEPFQAAFKELNL
jgi:hypothetical protein